jgi:hypothetical protein
MACLLFVRVTVLQAEHVIVIDCDGKYDTLRLLQVSCCLIAGVECITMFFGPTINKLALLSRLKCFHMTASTRLLVIEQQLPWRLQLCPNHLARQ